MQLYILAVGYLNEYGRSPCAIHTFIFSQSSSRKFTPESIHDEFWVKLGA
jgi:hypothetical protein